MPQKPTWLQRISQHGFLLGMVLAVAAASLFPGFGARGGAMHAEYAVNGGIALILFFLRGIGLPLPIMLYRQLQLFICSILPHRYARGT